MDIVICYDGTSPAKAAINMGIQMCRVFNAKAHIVMSVNIEDSQNEKYEFIENELSKEQKILTHAELVLKEAAKYMTEAQIPCKTHLLNRGLTPGEDFVSFAKEINAGYIVIGVRQRSKVGKLLTGSTAQHTILKAHCPVLTIPPKAQTNIKEAFAT
ncbi:MAG: universal stress protein [Thermodesulfobacteriota bacterium]